MATATPCLKGRITSSRNLDSISQKAGEVFAKKGFARVGIRELSSQLGIASGSIYYHIESKEALLCELIEDLYQTLLAECTRKSKRALPAQERLTCLLDHHLKLHAHKGAQFILAEREAHCLEGEHRALIDVLRARYEYELSVLMAETAGFTTPHDLRDIASSIVSLLNNLPGWSKGIRLDIPFQRDLILTLMQSFVEQLRKAAPCAKNTPVFARSIRACNVPSGSA